MKRLRTLKSFQIFKTEIKKSKTYIGWVSFSRPIQWYHSLADPIWPDGTFKSCSDLSIEIILMYMNYMKDIPEELGNFAGEYVSQSGISLD